MTPTLQTPAGPVSYAVSGPTDSGRPDLVLVHGWCCDRSVMSPLLEHFGRRHRVAVLDLRGHGASREDDDDGSTGVGLARPSEVDDLLPAAMRSVTIEDYAGDVRTIGQQAGLRHPVVVGHSMGGLVALEALRRGPADSAAPRGAVLLDPAPLVTTRGKAFWEDWLAELSRDFSGDSRRRFAQSLFLPTDRVGTDWVVELMAAAPAGMAVAAARALARYDGAEALATVRKPFLLVTAGRGEARLWEHLRDPDLLTTGQTVGTGHFHQLEAPEQVIPMIERWLDVTFRDGGAATSV
jgi:pimeloyl-ACP methyl ester carboxylesterase